MTAPTREQVEEWTREADRLATVDFNEGRDFGSAFRSNLAALAFAAGQSGQASGSGAELVLEVEEAAKSGPLPGGSTGDQIICRQVAQSLVYCDWWPRLRAALLAGDAAREDAARLDFYESNPHAIGYATGYRGSVSNWYSRKDGYVTDAQTLREAIDRAREGSDA